MHRKQYKARTDWAERLEGLGFTFHSSGGCYWNEGAGYCLSREEVDELESASEELYSLTYKAVEHVIENGRLGEFGIPASAWSLVSRSWYRGDRALYGRFDLAYDGSSAPKLLEFNADTPTSLLESAVVQWQWMKEVTPSSDQFNSVHEKLVARWGQIVPSDRLLHLVCCADSDEDLRTVEYLADTAIEAGIVTSILDIGEICWSDREAAFFDPQERPIQYLFKLYPWEWMLLDEFGEYLSSCNINFIEPPWKMVLSNKAILPVLWELFPDHPNLLPAFWEPAPLRGESFVEKPILSREGSNVTIMDGEEVVAATGGSYGDFKKVYQLRAPISSFDGHHIVIGSWIIGGESAGIGIREDTGLITTNTSLFVPHSFD